MGIRTGMNLSGVTRVAGSDASFGMTAAQAAALDTVIADSHPHTNKPTLDEISSEDGHLKFREEFIHIPLTNPGW